MRRDAELITQLLTFDKATLVYGLLQYRFRWLSFQDRSAALIGDFRKLGIFPALVALVISAPEFLKDSNPLLWSLLALVAILYIVAFDAALSRQRSASHSTTGVRYSACESRQHNPVRYQSLVHLLCSGV